MTIKETLAIIQRGTEEILPLDELKKKLEKNKPLRIKKKRSKIYSLERRRMRGASELLARYDLCWR